jgi:excinuclease ABC subunit C
MSEAHPAGSAPDFKALVASLPRRPGVYRMYDAAGTLIYVGKASQLRNRVSSYFSSRPPAPKVAAMVKRIANIEVTVVGSETEALLLECNLIKAHRPRYNVILRDDKSYPYIVCPGGHEYPRLVYWRGPKRPVGRQFGPFPNATAAREVLQHLQKVFRIRNCRDSFFSHRSRPCLQHQIGRCSAPCVQLIEPEDYRRDLEAAVRVLEGRSAEVADDLQQRMEQAAAARDYEAAADARDQISGLKEIQTRQIASAPRPRDLDAVAIVGDAGRYALSLLTVREGQVLGTASHISSNLGDAAETLASFLLLHYGGQSAPAEIATNIELPDRAAVAEALATLATQPVRLLLPDRGLAQRWTAMATDNAAHALRMHGERAASSEEAANALATALQLPAAPLRMECFDISHTAGEGTVASCVVFGPDGAEKRSYRRFNIEGITPGDDYAALQQALLRHGRRIVSGESPRPDLLLIDGGAAQVRAAAAGLAAAGCEGLRVLGISKGPARRPGQELLHWLDVEAPFSLPADSSALHLLQRIRDEAHRFAIIGHRRRRARRFSESIRETVAGLGPARRRALLTHFGGLQGVLRASIEDLQTAPGIGTAMARNLYDHLHPGE